MPKRKKKASEMTTEELARRVFPKKVVREIERLAHKSDDKVPDELGFVTNNDVAVGWSFQIPKDSSSESA